MKPKTKEDQDEIIKTTLRIPRGVWAKVRMLAIQNASSAEAITIEALTDYLKKVSK